MTTLTTLDQAIERLRTLTAPAVAPVRMPVADAVGWFLADALTAPRDEPRAPIAARDGIAIRAADADGAGAYAPAALAAPPPVALGDAMPASTDAVVCTGDVSWRRGHAELSQPVAPGDGVREAGRDARSGLAWRQAGDRLEAADLPLLAALGMTEVAVRVPRVVLLPTGDRFRGADPAPDAIGPGLAALIACDGGHAVPRPAVPGERSAIAAALADAAARGDLVLMIGGTGAGEGDHATAALADAGDVVLHGIGLRPGGSAGFGRVAGTPVLLLPGHPADAIGAWLALGRGAVRRLAGAGMPPGRAVRLTHKLVSTPGLAELALLRCVGTADTMRPFPAGDLTLWGFAVASAYLIVPAGAEGYEVGAAVDCLTL